MATPRRASCAAITVGFPSKFTLKEMHSVSTRGAYGFRIHGQDKITYNHGDSYPDGLGVTMLRWIASHSVAELKTMAQSLTLVSEDVPPTAEQIAACQRWANTGVSTGQLTEWYTLLRNTQGDPTAWDQGLRYLIDNASFLQDSLFCEWGYVINCDEETFEVYQGFNQDPEAQAPRYAIAQPDSQGYYACRLVAVGDLSRLPNAERFVAQLPSNETDERLSSSHRTEALHA